MARIRILIEVVAQVVIERKPLEETLMGPQKNLFVDQGRLMSQSRRSLLRILLLDGDNVGARYAAYIRPEPFDFTACR